MSLSNDERGVIVQLQLEKAKRFYAQALSAVEGQQWDLVANRLYYSAFHAVCGLLIFNGIQVGTHRGVVAMLNKEFVMTGKLTREEGHAYSRLQQLREEGDYNCYIQTTEEEIVPYVTFVKALIEKIETMVV